LFQPLSLALFVNGIIIKPINASIDAVKAIHISITENHKYEINNATRHIKKSSK
jgi:hypothetical protein